MGYTVACITLFFCNSMSSNMSYMDLNRVIKQCQYSCVLRFWGRNVRLHSDDRATVDTLALVYKHFVVPLAEIPDIECCLVRSYAGCQGPALFVGDTFYPLPDNERFLDHGA